MKKYHILKPGKLYQINPKHYHMLYFYNEHDASFPIYTNEYLMFFKFLKENEHDFIKPQKVAQFLYYNKDVFFVYRNKDQLTKGNHFIQIHNEY